MTPDQLNGAIEALRIKLMQLEHGQRVGYWQLMDQLDQNSAVLSQALHSELYRLEETGELVFIEDDVGSQSLLERRVPGPKKTKPAKKSAPKKKAKRAPKKKAATKRKKK
jgi:hypothetical protein